MPQPPLTTEGWYALHDIRRLDWAAWKALPPGERAKAAEEAVTALAGWMTAHDAGEGSTGLYRILGQKGDLLLLHFRPSLNHLSTLERDFAATRLADFTIPTYSYVSVTELSQHAPQAEGAEGGGAGRDDGPTAEGPAPGPRTAPQDPRLQARLKPSVPEGGYVCFYPMSKKRDGEDNWYMLPLERRRELMYAHGLIGRRYAGRVSQVITGSTGLDDWEWGVTLFADDPVEFKKIVYEMRFDETSARYGLFGPFYVGIHTAPGDLKAWLDPGR